MGGDERFNEKWANSLVNAEFWAIIGVGVALTGLQWRLYGSPNTGLNDSLDRIEACMDRIEADPSTIKERLSRIEGWIAGRFGEEPVPSA